MRRTSTILLLALSCSSLPLLLNACQVADGDIAASAALTAINLSASSDLVSERASHITGTIDLGYTSTQSVDVEILDNGVSVYSATFPADSAQINIDTTVALLFEGSNVLVAQATYNGQTVSQSLSLSVLAPLQTLTTEATTDALDERRTTLTGELVLGYTSDDFVAIRILDNSVPIYSTSSASSSLSIPIDATLDLLFEGANTLTVEASYAGQTISQSVSVNVLGPVQDLTAQATSDTLDQRTSRVTGDITLGYTSDDFVTVSILDNSVPVYSNTVAADSLSIPIDATVDLMFEGANTLTVEAEYAGSLATTSIDLTLPSALQAFELSPASSSVTELAVQLDGTAALGWMSAQDAVLTILVNGQSVSTQSYDASASLDLSFSERLPLSLEGSNTIEARLSYQGNVLSDSFNVTVPIGVESLSLIPNSSPPTTLSTRVTGTAALGYTSDLPAQLDIWVEGDLAFTQIFDATASTTVGFDTTVALPHAGDNEIIATLQYGSTTLTDGFTVAVAGAIQDFSLSPASGTVDIYETSVTGSATLGYTSDVPAVLDVMVDGSSVYTQTVDVSSNATPSLSATIPLTHNGDNEVTARLSYDGAVYTDGFTVAVAPPSPVVTFPISTGWNEDFTDGVSMVVTDVITVDAQTGWQTDGVSFSTDGGLTWMPAISKGGGDWEVSLLNPTILSQPIVLRVDSSNNGTTHTTYSYDTVSVDPRFDCGDSGAMLPSNDLIQDNREEVRTMSGYFSDPNSLHSVNFVISGRFEGDDYTVVGQNMVHGPMFIDTLFRVDRLKCGGNCQDPYDLEVFVDGQSVCSRGNYGDVIEY